jgi:hypothetical protein
MEEKLECSEQRRGEKSLRGYNFMLIATGIISQQRGISRKINQTSSRERKIERKKLDNEIKKSIINMKASRAVVKFGNTARANINSRPAVFYASTTITSKAEERQSNSLFFRFHFYPLSLDFLLCFEAD